MRPMSPNSPPSTLTLLLPVRNLCNHAAITCDYGQGKDIIRYDESMKYILKIRRVDFRHYQSPATSLICSTLTSKRFSRFFFRSAMASATSRFSYATLRDNSASKSLRRAISPISALPSSAEASALPKRTYLYRQTKMITCK